jgi:hypothetical protein
LCEKAIEYFKRLTADQIYQAKQWTEITTISDKAQETGYAVAVIVANEMKSSTISEPGILPE